MPVTTIPNSATTNLRRKLSWANVETPETYAADNNHPRFTTETINPPRRKARRPRLNLGARARVGGMEVDEDEVQGIGDGMQVDDEKQNDDSNLGARTRTGSMEVEIGEMQGLGYEMHDDIDEMQEDDESDIEIISSSTTATKKDMEEYQRMMMLRREAERERARAMEEEDEALARALAEEYATLEPTTSEQDDSQYVKFVRRGNRFKAIARAREERGKTIAATQKYEQLQKLLQQEQQSDRPEGEGSYVGINIDNLPETVADIPAFVAKLKARGFGEEKIKWVFEKIGWGGMEKMGVVPEAGKGGRKVKEDWEVDGETIEGLEGSEEWREYQRKMEQQAGLNWKRDCDILGSNTA